MYHPDKQKALNNHLVVLLTKRQKGTLPPTLSALSEIGVTPPKDPFSTGMPKYILRGNGATLYSIGPDLSDNQGKLEYDPTNGVISPGDIAVSVR